MLGGTSEGFALARVLGDESGLRVVSSLAGVTSNPRLPRGKVRIGGFGGIDGLSAYLRDNRIGIVVDATHPFAATIGGNAETACHRVGVPLLRLERPVWTPGHGDRWIEVADWAEAAAVVARTARRVLLAVGRREVAAFATLAQIWFLVRAVEAPDPMPGFEQAELLLARGPFSRDDERRLLIAHRVDTIVCRNSGGSAAKAKLVAARELGLQVVLRRRPPRPGSLPCAASVSEAAAWVRALRAG
ncbi:MAG: cobalt-precorrin-6A reductase [Stellaceae bacterium]